MEINVSRSIKGVPVAHDAIKNHTFSSGVISGIITGVNERVNNVISTDDKPKNIYCNPENDVIK